MPKRFSVINQIISDRFIWLLIIAALIAMVLPVDGDGVAVGSLISSIGIFCIFLLHGIRLQRHEVIAGLKNIKLQGGIFAFVFGVMMVAGLFLSKVLDNFLPSDLALGFLFLGLLPSTVQSATSYCAIARGNVAASVIASAFINLSGIIIAPVLFAILASAAGVAITSDAFVRIGMILLLPFIVGQLVQRWTRDWVMAHSNIIGWADKIVIAIIVYISFSGAVTGGITSQINASQLAVMLFGLVIMLAFGFGGAWSWGGWLKLVHHDRKTMLFSGAQKSIAIGAPLAAIIFPPERAGMILLPLLIYHLTQLVISAPLALRLAKS